MLRDYQRALIADIEKAHGAGARNVCAVSPTGSGKGVVLAHILKSSVAPACVMAHRTELVCQISVALARVGAEHRIIAPTPTIAAVLAEHRRELGYTCYSPHAPLSVAAVDTLLARADRYAKYAAQCDLWIVDEAAHLLKTNKWGKCTELFPNARGIGFTATPKRADGQGLGSHNHGVFDALVQGPTVAQLIAMGYLSKYRILAQPSDLSVDDLKATASGDYSAKVIATRAHASHIVGDVVAHYLKHAAGKQGITFATDVETAMELAAQFRAQGVPAECVSAKTHDAQRAAIIRRFREGEIKQLTNCDLFGEGFDVPGVEVVSLARPTCSLSLFLQQVGRAMRPAPGKEFATIIDHVGNWQRHGLPDTPRRWSLEPRERANAAKKDPDVTAATSCLACFLVFPRAKLPVCPYCGHNHPAKERRRPEQVDGDLSELDPDVLSALRESVNLEDPDRVQERIFHATGNQAAALKARADRCERIEAQNRLREVMAMWSGYRGDNPLSEQYREFFLTFGVDVLSAQTWTRKDMDELTETIKGTLAP